MKKKLWGGQFWSDGYFVSTVGQHGTENTVRNYVKQQGRDKEYSSLHIQQPRLFDSLDTSQLAARSCILISDDTKKPVTTGLQSLQGQYLTNWPVITAGALLAALPTVVVFVALQRYFIQGLTMGSGK